MFFGCGLMGGLGDGWVRMGKSAVGGFGGYGSGWVEFHGLWDMAVGGLRWVDRWWVSSCCWLWWWVMAVGGLRW